MKQFLVLSKENIELSSWEVKEYLNIDNYELVDNFMIFTKEYEERSVNLAYTKKILKLLFRCDVKEIKSKLESFDFDNFYEKDFSLRIPQDNSLEVEYSSYIWETLEVPKVNLKNPHTKFEIYFSDKEAFVCLLIKELDNNFESRKSHKRPSPHPSSLHPKLARAMVNMLGDVKVVVDPFCGSGGTLIEAALAGNYVVGIDLDPIMIKRCYNNLKHFGIEKFELEQADSTTVQKMDYFVADLPYGLNTKSQELNGLYDKFFSDLQFKKAVVGFPDFIDYKKILKKHDIKIKKEFDYYLHKSLNKKILILSLR
ncbi:methyltransferase domain-containing protein [Candidatus Woesearchaeota archaeon]|nr:methyltransferase domain-containing protein [Candidatus Woesearchaeota archaeon]